MDSFSSITARLVSLHGSNRTAVIAPILILGVDKSLKLSFGLSSSKIIWSYFFDEQKKPSCRGFSTLLLSVCYDSSMKLLSDLVLTHVGSVIRITPRFLEVFFKQSARSTAFMSQIIFFVIARSSSTVKSGILSKLLVRAIPSFGLFLEMAGIEIDIDTAR